MTDYKSIKDRRLMSTLSWTYQRTTKSSVIGRQMVLNMLLETIIVTLQRYRYVEKPDIDIIIYMLYV